MPAQEIAPDAGGGTEAMAPFYRPGLIRSQIPCFKLSDSSTFKPVEAGKSSHDSQPATVD
jgi:hypothetical protein